jgi:hypothetical protein
MENMIEASLIDLIVLLAAAGITVLWVLLGPGRCHDWSLRQLWQARLSPPATRRQGRAAVLPALRWRVERQAHQAPEVRAHRPQGDEPVHPARRQLLDLNKFPGALALAQLGMESEPLG